MDINLETYLIDQLDDVSLRRKNQVDFIKSLPQLEQKSPAWFEMRNSCITATAVSEIMDESPYNTPTNVLLDKCGLPKEFIQNEFVHHGNKFEEIVSLLVTIWFLAFCPTIISPFLNATTDGVVLIPSGLVITLASPPSYTDTQLFVVPKSIPIILLIFINLLYIFISLHQIHE